MQGASPLWRRTVLRSVSATGWGALLVAALLAATTSAAAAPLVIEQSADSALASTLSAVPEGSRIADTTAVRVVGGRSPRSEDAQIVRLRLDAIPGLTPSTLTGVSVGPETHPGVLFRPLVRAGDEEERARLAAIEDPASSLVVTSQDPSVTGGAWLPDPVAERLGVGAGDVVQVLVQTADAARPAPPDAPPTVIVPLTVAGTYAVAADGRRPADPPGTTTWSRRTGVLPADTDFGSLAAYLIVTDVATADRTAQAIGDDMLWAVESELEPGLSLEEAQVAAAGVAELRSDVRGDENQPPGVLRTGLASGLEALVYQATTLADLSAERVRLLAGVGVAAGLLALLALAVLLAADRRQELAHGAAVGVGPGRVAGLWFTESVLPVVAAAVAGVGCAWLLMLTDSSDAGASSGAWADAWRASGVVAAAGALLVAAVGAVACTIGERPEPAHGRRRLPWVALVAVLTATALVAAVTTPATSPGPVALAVPALVAVSVGSLVATAAAFLLRLRRAGDLPRAVPAASRWLAVRRLARAGSEQVLAVAAMTLGLAMVLFAVSGVAATRVVVADRTAVLAGAPASAQLHGSWVLDPDARTVPTIEEQEKGVKVPEGTSPPLPPGHSAVWRSLTSFEGDFGYRDLLVIDPATFDGAADWGEGPYLEQVRELTRELSVSASTAQPDGSIPVISVNDPALQPGDVVTITGQGWQSGVRVIGSVSAFPGQGQRPMIVATSPSLLPRWGRSDPRLAPAEGYSEPPRAFAESWVWSSGSPAELAAMIESRGASPLALGSSARAAQQPVLVAAQATLGFQLALAGFLALAAVVAAALHSRRVSRRSRAADALLARSGMGVNGVRRARTWESVLLVVLALVSAVAAVALVARIGPLLLDLDRRMVPAFELRLTPTALLVTAGAAAVMLAVAWWVGARDSGGSRRSSPEEVVLRDGR